MAPCWQPGTVSFPFYPAPSTFLLIPRQANTNKSQKWVSYFMIPDPTDTAVPWWHQKHRHLSLLLPFFVAIDEVQLFLNDPSRLQQKKRLLALMSVYIKVKESFAMKFALARALPCLSLARNGLMWPPLRPSLQKKTGYHKWLLIRVYPHTGEQSKKKRERELEC